MAANYISTADFDAVAGGQTLREKLYTPAGGTYSSAAFVRASELASAQVQAAAASAGYSVGDTTSSDVIVLAAIGYLATMAWGRNTEKVPDQFHQAIHTFRDLASGKLKISGLTPTVKEAIGGVKFTGINADVDTDHAQIFNRASRNLY